MNDVTLATREELGIFWHDILTHVDLVDETRGRHLIGRPLATQIPLLFHFPLIYPSQRRRSTRIYMVC